MKFYYLIACLVLALTGCGGGGGGNSDDSSSGTDTNTDNPIPDTNDPAPNANIKTGLFLDSPVINLGYKTETQNGFTNSLGEYNYIAGETVTFFIGALEFTPVTATGIVTPLDFAGATLATDPTVVNIIRLLQTLDKDGNPDNGLEITAEAIASATALDFGLGKADFESLPAIQALLDNAGLDTPVEGLVNTAVAIQHFEDTIKIFLGSKAFPSGAIITGDTVGSGNAANSTLRKEITFTVTNPDSRILFSDAYVAKSVSTNLDTIYWMVFATNVSDEALCLIQLDDGLYKDSQGQTLETDSVNFVRGSVRLLNGSIATDSCLLAGEKGLLLGIENNITNIYTDISEIVYDTMSISSSSNTPTNATIEHTGTYQAGENTTLLQEINLPILNTGATTGTLSSLSAFVLLDETELPLKWGFFSPPEGGEVLNGDETVSITGDIIFDGTANNMHAYVNYDDLVLLELATTAAKKAVTIAPSGLSNDDYAAYMNDARNQAEAYKASLVAE